MYSGPFIVHSLLRTTLVRTTSSHAEKAWSMEEQTGLPGFGSPENRQMPAQTPAAAGPGVCILEMGAPQLAGGQSCHR